MVDKLWFGHARGHLQYVPCPLIDSSVTRNRYVERIQFENGGGDGRRSNQYQMQYDFQFSGLAHEVDGIDAFNKYAQGFYGDDLIHLAHPAAFETNLFPAGWATPSLSEKGWGKISSDAVAYSNADGPMITNLVTNPSMEGVASGTDSTKRTNLITNPSFEGNTTTGWTSVGGSTTLSASTTRAYLGTYSMSATGNGAAGAKSVQAQLTVTNGATYTGSAWVWVPTGTTVQAQLSDGVTAIGVNIVGNNTWQKFTQTKTVANTNLYFEFILPSSSSATYYVDAVMLEAASEARSYFDGTYAEDPTLIEAWTGTVNNSTSTALVRGASNRENLVTNPSFEVDTTGWSTYGSDVTLSRVTTQKYVGAASAQFSATTTGTKGIQFTNISATANTAYTASAWVYASAGTAQTRVRISWYNGATFIGAEEGALASLTIGQWTRLTISGTAPANTTRADVIIYMLSATTSDVRFVDSVMLEQSATLNPYFDGSYTDAPGWTTSWAGTANASRSVATAAPVTVRTNLVTNPSMEAVTSGTVVMRRNLSKNPRGVSGGSTSEYLTRWSWPVSYRTDGSTGLPAGVTSYVRFTSPSALTGLGRGMDSYGNTDVAPGTTGDFLACPVQAGQTYTVSYYVRASFVGSLEVKLNFHAGAGSWVATTTKTTYSYSTSGQWMRVSHTMTAPTGYSSLYLAAGLHWSSITFDTSSTFDVTGMVIESSSTVGDFFDGSTTDALGWDYAWSGTANASISTAACAATTVRTNLVTNPRGNTTAGFTAVGATSLASTAISDLGGYDTAISWTTSAVDNRVFTESSTAITAGTYYFSAWVKAPSGSTYYLRPGASGGGFISGATIPTITGTGSWQKVTGSFAAYDGTIGWRIEIRLTGGTAGNFLATGWTLTLGLSDPFDGSFNPAGDFSYAWTGTANASTSIQRGATVASYAPSSVGSVASREWTLTGNQSLRVIPTSTSNNDTFVSPGGDAGAFRLGMSVGNTYTVSGTIRLAAAQTGTLNARARRIAFFYKNSAGTYVEAQSTQAPNAAGSTRLSVTVTIPSGATEAFIRLYNGAPLGGGDVWWDNVMLEASPIVQDYFDGSVVSADADLTNSWSGTPHASTSLKRGVGVATVSYFNGVAIQSSGWASTGTKSIRVIPTISDTSSAGFFAVTTTVGQTYTAKAKVRLASPQTGTLNGNARKIVAYNSTISTFLGASNQAPNVAGVTEVSMTFVATTTTTNIIFYSGASAGNGDVWLDDFIVVAGTYTGGYFDGNSTDSGNTTYNWTGTANASTSTMLSEMVLYGNPPRATTYTVTNINQPPTKVCTLVIPPEYTLYLGASGTSTGSAGVFIRPIQASDSLYYGPTEKLTLLDPNGSVRMNKTLNGATYQAVEIFLMKTDAAAGTVTLNSMMAQLYKTGTTPQLPSEHYQGEGSTGLMFADDAIVETYSYMHPPRKGIATTLIEVEAWR